MNTLTPSEIVYELDKHIIGQGEAKRAVAIALRNRWRRSQVPEPLRSEISPKNILMIGPTGVGKTEIARRLSRLANAPFIKVEATKFTEVGYVGRDVESIIRDLLDIAIKMIRQAEIQAIRPRAELAAEERILNALLPGVPSWESDSEAKGESSTRQKFRNKLRMGELDDKEVELEVTHSTLGMEIMAPPGMEEMSNQLQNMFQTLQSQRPKLQKMRVADALRTLIDEESEKMVNEDDLKQQAIHSIEQNGIVFIDEFDKICRRYDAVGAGPDISREGVQRDLLPLVEGCSVTTRFGPLKTDHILFIASGAFHLSKPSDLIPEMQGRFPIRVELDALEVEDFVKILTEPDASLTQQYTSLLATEGVELKFTPEGIRRIAELSWEVNTRTENIGARRLHTVLERLLESVSFDANSRRGQSIIIDALYVEDQLGQIANDEDLSRYIL
jgi:ATP-dependent HslUV protease ATP-binding subunit HslU